MKTIIKENMTPNDFIQVQALSMTFPKKEMCVVNYSDEGTILYFYLNGVSFFEMGEDVRMSSEEIRSTCGLVLQLVKMSGGNKNLRSGFKKFLELLSQEFVG
jgi:hypothetical protein